MAASNSISDKQNIDKLVSIVQQLSSTRDLNEVISIVHSAARELTGADGATFVLRDGNNCYYADEDAIEPLWKGQRFPMDTCISGWVMKNKEHAVIENIYIDDRIPQDAYRPTFVKSLVMVPIRTKDPLGAIGNYWSVQRLPTEDEIKMLRALADITAVSIENIERRNNLENMVRERTEKLNNSLERERELNKVKSTFVSMASHEFRTPLTSILSSVALAERYTDSDQQDKRERHYTRIKSSVKNLVELLNDFLSLDKLQQGVVETESELFNLEEFLRDVIVEMDGMRKDGQNINLNYDGEKEIKLDKKVLRNVMLNLLSNAIKYSDNDIDLIVDIADQKARISVVDQGIGIPTEQQEQLFSKFFRASNTSNIQGTGLGLNIVKHYVHLLEGSIDFESTEGAGTTFTLCFDSK